VRINLIERFARAKEHGQYSVRNGWKEEAEKRRTKKLKRSKKERKNKERIKRGGRREEGRKENVWVA
jgi:hypothetical protein